jgi:hypothetical protein
MTSLCGQVRDPSLLNSRAHHASDGKLEENIEMAFGRTITAFVAAAMLALGAMSTAHAGDDDKAKNLKVIKETKTYKDGMKSLNKGLGTKCEACHVKGKFEADDKPEKEAARKFLTATVGEKDAAKRGEALKALLDAMKLKEAKDADAVWKGVDAFEKQ